MTTVASPEEDSRKAVAMECQLSPRVQIVCEGTKDLGNIRPLGSKLLELPAELLVVLRQRCDHGFELLLALGRLGQAVQQALRLLEPTSHVCAEV
jgi:hypothetical protein